MRPGTTTRLRLAGVAASALALAALAPGCLVFKTLHSVTQVQTIGDVLVTSTVCTSSSAVGSTCPRLGLNKSTFESLGTQSSPPVQILLGYRVPAGVQGPASFTSTGQIVRVFAPNASYAAELQRLVPAPAGQVWLGYASTSTYVFNPLQGVKEATVTVEFSLPAGADGTPFPGTLRYRPVVGLRGVGGSQPITRPVGCGSDATAGDTTEATICITDTGPGGIGGTPVSIASDQSAAVRDLGFPSAGVSATAAPGALATVPFIARYPGTATPTATFTITASTTLPGATAVPSTTTLVPATNSATPIPVVIGVPAGAAAGTYDVSITARLSNGLTRNGIGHITVAAQPGGGGTGGGAGTTPGAIAPKVSVVVARRLSLQSARSGGIRALIGSTRAIRATVALRRAGVKKAVATRTVMLKAPGPLTVTFRPKRLRPGTFRVSVSGTGFALTRVTRVTAR